MKNYPHILSKVYGDPWLITRQKHLAIQQLLDSRLSGAGPVDDAIAAEAATEPQMEGPILVIPIHGIIGKHLDWMESACGGYDLNTLNEAVETAIDDASVRAVLFDVRSPGGTVTGVLESGEIVRDLTAKKPTAAYTDSECCSAAYWLASQCDRVFATRSSKVGSIGVYTALMDYSEALDKEGVKVNAIFAGKYKLAGAPFKPLTSEERKMFQERVDQIYQQFTDAVVSMRDVSSEVMQGQVFTGEIASENGLADGTVGNIQEALDLLKQEALALR